MTDDEVAVMLCGCFTCIGDQPTYPGSFLTVGMTWMIVCGLCGNKRCPHGTDHRNECTTACPPPNPTPRPTPTRRKAARHE